MGEHTAQTHMATPHYTKEKKAHCWHLMEHREVGASKMSHYYLSNAPHQTSLKELVRVQAQRFFIDHSFREAKNKCGMANYQVHRWDAWHHHLALVMLILRTLFLLKQNSGPKTEARAVIQRFGYHLGSSATSPTTHH